MKGHDCEHCAAYLAAVGGSPGEREAILNMCSRCGKRLCFVTWV